MATNMKRWSDKSRRDAIHLLDVATNHSVTSGGPYLALDEVADALGTSAPALALAWKAYGLSSGSHPTPARTQPRYCAMTGRRASL